MPILKLFQQNRSANHIIYAVIDVKDSILLSKNIKIRCNWRNSDDFVSSSSAVTKVQFYNLPEKILNLDWSR